MARYVLRWRGDSTRPISVFGVCVCREDALDGSFRVDGEYVGMLVYSEEGV